MPPGTRPRRTRALLSWLLTSAVVTACEPGPFREIDVDAPPPGDDGPSARRLSEATLRFSVAAMQSPADTYTAYSTVFERIGRRLGLEVELLQRRTYGEVNDMLVGGKLDAALICTGGYLDLLRRSPDGFAVLAVPVVGGQTTYHSLTIVPSRSAFRSLRDLAGKRFAFTDPLSLSGRAYVVHVLHQRGLDAEDYFGAVQYTHSHDRSIDAVARGLVDGASVDSLIYDRKRAEDAAVATGTRVVERSQAFGMPPVVASLRLPRSLRHRLRDALLEIEADATAALALRTMGVERFVAPAPDLYTGAAEVVGERR